MQIESKIRSERASAADMASLVTWPVMAARTIPLPGRRARLRLEAMVWDGFDEIARREGRPVTDLCNELDATRPSNVSLATAVRTFVLDYFRAAN